MCVRADDTIFSGNAVQRAKQYLTSFSEHWLLEFYSANTLSIFFLPETTERTLEDIESLFSEKYSLSYSSSPIAGIPAILMNHHLRRSNRQKEKWIRRESRVVFNISYKSKDSTDDSGDDEEDGSLVHSSS